MGNQQGTPDPEAVPNQAAAPDINKQPDTSKVPSNVQSGKASSVNPTPNLKESAVQITPGMPDQQNEGDEHAQMMKSLRVTNTFQTRLKQLGKRSKVQSATLNENKLTVTRDKNVRQYGLDSEVMRVPFQVVIVELDEQLKDTFLTMGQQLYLDCLVSNQWKLHGNGFYVNYEEGFILTIISQTMIYKGTIDVTKQNRMIPEGEGVLLTKNGAYQGQFQRGKAHGKGIFEDKHLNAIFDGKWEKGVMVEGKIENNHFKYTGTFKDRDADGQGRVFFYQTKSMYKGRFQSGKYHCQNKKAVYRTKKYQYQGQFFEGNKEGAGELFENPLAVIPKKSKYQPPEIYKGDWIDDYYVTPREERAKRLLEQEEGHQMIGQMFDQAVFGGVAQRPSRQDVNQQYGGMQPEESEYQKVKEREGRRKGGMNKDSAPAAEQVYVIPEYVEEEALGSQL